MTMFSASLSIIATGDYRNLLPEFLASADRYFLPENDVVYHVFSDVIPEGFSATGRRQQCWHQCKHEPWPGPTLHRYRTMLSAAEEVLNADYSYYIDVDMRCVDYVCGEIFSDLVAVRHHGYLRTPVLRLPYERRAESRVRIPPTSGRYYYAGGFQGGRSKTWFDVMNIMASMLDADERRGVIPVHNDESAWNWLLTRRAPSWTLPEQYCWHPRSPRRPYSVFDKNNPPKIIALDKDQKLIDAKRK